MFKPDHLKPEDMPVGYRSRTELNLSEFSIGAQYTLTKTYHEPSTSSKLRRKIIASLIDHDFIPMSPEDSIHHEVSRLRDFAAKGILVPEIYQQTERSYTMEFIPHRTAEQHLADGKLEVIDNILLTANQLHMNGLTHGDLFPANIIPLDDTRSIVLDPGVKYADQDTITARFRDLTQALFRIGHFVPEMAPVLQTLKTLYHKPEELHHFYHYVIQTSIPQEIITNIVFKDIDIFSRMKRAMKSVFAKPSNKEYYY